MSVTEVQNGWANDAVSAPDVPRAGQVTLATSLWGTRDYVTKRVRHRWGGPTAGPRRSAFFRGGILQLCCLLESVKPPTGELLVNSFRRVLSVVHWFTICIEPIRELQRHAFFRDYHQHIRLSLVIQGAADWQK